MSGFAERFIHRLDVAVRRQSRFGQHPWLRKVLLRPYRKLINFHGRGVLMSIGGCIPARLPSDYAWNMIEYYEPENVSALKKWLGTVENPVVVDAGCSLGFVTCAGLPSDYYLWLTGQAGKMLRGEIRFTRQIPDRNAAEK